jgi:hypothetical protein
LLIGRRSKVFLSNGERIYFIILDKINENKHWATFIENEIYEWNYY